jgi:hypothetical protein
MPVIRRTVGPNTLSRSSSHGHQGKSLCFSFCLNICPSNKSNAVGQCSTFRLSPTAGGKMHFASRWLQCIGEKSPNREGKMLLHPLRHPAQHGGVRRRQRLCAEKRRQQPRAGEEEVAVRGRGGGGGRNRRSCPPPPRPSGTGGER